MSKLNAFVVLALIAGCSSPPPANPNVVAANREDRAQSLCTATARAGGLRVTSTDQPIQIDAQRYEIAMRTRDAGGVVQRTCIADLANNRVRFM
ncbi:MAG: hypothetical protein SFX73_23725 [Kofleriaceae bacterium]|nr:hypothetical protein [Kofleriaceae bacterium]